MSDKATDQTLDHEYDGIQEYDNRLPNWWLATLYGSIFFSVIYWGFYETLRVGDSQEEAYVAEVASFAEWQLAQSAGKEIDDDSLLLMSQIPDRVAAGKEIFAGFCVECHNAQGEGNVGPNLTDPYWINGGSPMEIYKTVSDGVLEKGMAAWMNQLGPTRVQQVVAYVLTLKNTNIKGKKPEGELEEEAKPTEETAANGGVPSGS